MTSAHASTSHAIAREGSRVKTLLRRLGGGRAVDVLGVGLLFVAVGWTFANQAAPLATRWAVAGVFLASAAAYVMARLAAEIDPRLVPATIVVAGLVIAFASRDEVLAGAPLASPLGYENANAALFLQATIGSLMLLHLGKRPALRAFGFVVAVFFGVLTLLIGSVAGIILLVPTAGVAFIRSPRAVRGAIWACAVLFAFVLAMTVGLGSSFGDDTRGGPVDRLIDSSLSERRVELWHDALAIMGQHPGSGVGAGQFWRHSPLASSDRDARWAHHEFLQQGAEGGVIGFVLLVAVFGWAFVRLRVAPVPSTQIALGAVSVAALGIHACVDYVLHFVALPAGAAALLGAAARSGSINTRVGVDGSPQLHS